MKLIMVLILVLGLITTGVAWLAQVRAISKSTMIVSGIADLRQENNMDKCQTAENITCRQLRNIRDSFVPLMWFGCLTAALALVGIVIADRKHKDRGGQPPA